ncbi:CRTAC1 family protein [Candidatus Poribacteria bacterium]|nr:CRTAC1 family protein [Candidatus Poribacteria bacterium]MBT5535204.1 CRTAC1 family protein [Candidatus Poribacteria bacterium]MBT5714393.1 CRTAC1 family protein [Candidatus Poribacteria bacterium]MBT7097888.1 CRTAC1 family protein [Candidatus Poribacteria bacterium]MBT7809577.1 CRTAC1 family protein [Candidatus Poribacteria bacterium]
MTTDLGRRSRVPSPSCIDAAQAPKRLTALCVLLIVAGLAACDRGADTPAAVAPVASAPLRFTETAVDAGIDFVSMYRDDVLDYVSEAIGGGAAWLDYDNDDDWDVYITTGAGHPNALYRNDGGTFTLVSAEAGVGHEGCGMGAAAADYDADGWPDLFVTNFGAPDALYRNRGDGTFEDVTTSARVGGEPTEWSASAAWGDVDGDGDLDLYVARYVDFSDPSSAMGVYVAVKPEGPETLHPEFYAPQANALYANNGDGTFDDVTDRAGVRDAAGKGLAVAFADYDNDADLDLYVANDVSANTMFTNRGDGTFADTSFLTGTDDLRAGMGIDFGDIDEDGDLDFFVTYLQDEMNGLYRNNTTRHDAAPSDTFDDIASEAGVAMSSLGLTGWGTVLEDFDGDGDFDLFVTNGHVNVDQSNPVECIGQRDQVFRNDDGALTDAPDAFAFTDWRAGRGLAAADYDNDGDVDVLVVQNNARALLFRNDTQSTGDWVKVRAPVGARIHVQIGGRTLIREARAGSSFLSTHAPEMVIATPGGRTVDRVTMARPRQETVSNPPPRSVTTFYADDRPATVTSP